ncbi:MAG: hypothetical protein KGY70_17160 [Bacteroidales bacterium]|nr:hypothetical protein [Bacteroidales bacterium]
MKSLSIVLLSVLIIEILGCTRVSQNTNDVIIENEQMRLVIAPNGKAQSLFHKPTKEECLMQNAKVAVFSMVVDVDYSPYDDVFKSNVIPMGEREFTPDSVYRKGDQLIAHFDIIDVDAVIGLDIQPQYIHFEVEDFVNKRSTTNLAGNGNINPDISPRVDEMWFLRLPIRNRSHYGEWLNVTWDDQWAVNILGTDSYTRIKSDERNGYRILKAGMISEVKSKGVGAGLITTSTDNLLDDIARVEEDFNLPHGVKNRRSEKADLSTYWSGNITPDNVDEHVEYAKKGGFRTFYVYYTAFSKAPGHYEWRDEYSNGIEDLQEVVKKIKNAGMSPGVHIHYNKASKSDPYITKVDHRLNLRKYFTLAAPLGRNDTTITVEENPRRVTLDEGRRILKIGDELISYSDYTTVRPYKFTGCSRGALNTKPASHSMGNKFGLLDLDDWPKFVRLDQQTSIQGEVAERLAEIYQKAGFEFIYFDGAEDVHSPHWFNTAKAQWEVYKRLDPEPIFAAGSVQSHFSWHMLSRGNHYDSHNWPPKELKQAIRDFPGNAAPLMADNFTASTFGRYRYFVPDENSIGMQPDMFEYLTSRASAWGSPWILKSNVEEFEDHPRTSDNLEVIRRWEEAKAQDWLTEEQKQMLRDWEQEHILLVNKQEEFELVPYEQIKDVAKGEVRAFIFERQDDLYVVYWHIKGDKNMELPLKPEKITLLKDIGEQTEVQPGKNEESVVLPVSRRRYVKTDQLSREELISAFQNATIFN